MTERYADLADYDWLMEQIILHESEQAARLGFHLMSLFKFESVIDIGCGPGIYLLPFKQAGMEVYGIDGAPAAGQSLDAHEFELVDLRNPWTPPKQFDLVLCVEVAEHLKLEHAENLIGIICKSASLVFFTAARPGQGGEGHWNEQPKEYWIALFEKFGFVLDPGHTSAIHALVDIDPAYEHCNWIRWNSIMLRKK